MLTLCEAQPVKQAQTTTPGTTCPTCVLEPAGKNNSNLNTYKPFTDMSVSKNFCDYFITTFWVDFCLFFLLFPHLVFPLLGVC